MSKPISWPTPADGPTDLVSALRHRYLVLRVGCHELEEVLERVSPGIGGLTVKDIKRLDKAVTVMKVGFKLAKKALKKRDEATAPRLRRVS